MPKETLTHSSSRSQLCIIDFRKIKKNGKILYKNSKLHGLVTSFYPALKSVDLADPRYPNAVCMTCYNLLYAHNRNDKTKPLPKLHCYSALKDKSNITRDCHDCEICLLVKSKTKTTPDACECDNCGKEIPSTSSKEANSTEEDKSVLKASVFIDMQHKVNISNKGILDVAQCLRKELGRGAIESNLRDHLKEARNLLEDYFYYSEQSFFISEQKGYQDRILVTVKDIDTFVKYILNQRDLDPHDHIVRIGLDGGGTFLKLCLSIFKKQDNVQLPHKRHQRSVQSPFLDTGVKKSFIIGIVQSVFENYENIQKIFSHIKNFESIKYHICNDLKATSIILGIQNASSKHPCPFCVVDDLGVNHDPSIDHTPRTFGSIKDNASEYKNNNCKRSEAKEYYNCIELPLIPGEGTVEIGDIVVPPELHIMQGVVKHLYDNMCKEWDGASQWLTNIGIQPQKYHSGSFLGNHCHVILQNVDELRRIAPINILKYVLAFEAFSKLVHACFGLELRDNYEELIKIFTTAFMELGISVTLKVHVVMAHIGKFCDKFGALGWFSEQATESSHSDFKHNTWEKHKLQRQIGHHDYSENLLRAMIMHNSTRV